MDEDYDDEYTYAGIGSSRFHYEDNNEEMSSNDSVSSDDSNVEYVGSKKKKDNAEQIYGVFGESDSDDEAHKNQRHRRKTKRSDRSTPWKVSKKMDLASTFVKSENPDIPRNESEDKEDQQEIFAKTPEEIEEEKERKRELDEANSRFNMLLERGKRKRPLSKAIETEEHTQIQSIVSQNKSRLLRGIGSDETTLGLSEDRTEFNPPSVMVGGLGFKGDEYNEKDEKEPSLSSFISSSSKMSNFVGKSQEKESDSRTIQKDPTIGQWEKHTKGIGMKLLLKMGYKGSGGLGGKRLRKKVISEINEEGAVTSVEKVEVEERTGISKPVEVIVRPQNLGLGFGSFKEATKLKVNQRIEAEVRGIDWEKQEAEERKKKQLEEEERMRKEFGIQSSALPSTDSLMASGNWRKSAIKRKKHKKEIKVVSYRDIIEGSGKEPSKEKVIDMRGPSSSTITTSEPLHKDAPVKLGEELLHNVTFLLNTYENKLHSSSHFARSSRSKAQSLMADVQNLEDQRKRTTERRQKLEKVLSLIETIENIHSQKVDISSKDEIEEVQKSLHSLSAIFSTEEKESLQYFNVLLPSLITPIFKETLSKWDFLNLSSDEISTTLSSLFDLCSSVLSNETYESSTSFMNVIISENIIPHIRKSFQSPQWDAVTKSEVGVDVYEVILETLKNIKVPNPEPFPDVDGSIFGGLPGNHQTDLSTVIKDRILFDVIYPKISRSLLEWKPSHVNLFLHTWLVPWLPHLDYRSMLANLIPDIKRKLKISLVHFCKGNSENLDRNFFQSVANMLKPWINILSKSSIQQITSECITPHLGRALAQMSISDHLSEQKWDSIDIIFHLHGDGMLSNMEFLSLVEGEVMLPMASKLYEMILNKKLNASEAATYYSRWRTQITTEAHFGGSFLKNDSYICRIFYGCLLMIKAATDQNFGSLDVLEPIKREFTNYKVVQARRAKEQRLKEEEEALRGRANDADSSMKTHVSVHGKGGATFREVVEDFANHNGVTFHPKPGPNSSKDGKPIFIFGNSQIYLDSNVVFAYKNDEWKPISLSDLMYIS
jgi:tuftelin-interacting protein 11